LNTSPISVFRFSTECLEPIEAYEVWRTILGEFYEVLPPDPDETQSFSAALDAWNIGGVMLTNGVFSGQTFSRNAARTRRDGLDNYTVLLHKTGLFRAEAGGKVIENQNGQICVLDFAQPHASEVGHNDSITLSLPRDFLDEVLPPRDVHGLALRGPQGALFGEFLRSLCRMLPDLTAQEAPFVAAACRDLLAACISGSAEARERAQPQIDALGVGRARRLIDANLHRPDWGVDDLRLALGVSRATLYRMFQHLGGVVAYIRTRRLLRAHRLLAASSGFGRVSDVARRCGFSSDGTFSRAFRDAYGYSPREARDHGKPSFAGWTQSAGRSSPVDDLVGDWIRFSGSNATR
jgi:AraC-like DNA-binding protein